MFILIFMTCATANCTPLNALDVQKQPATAIQCSHPGLGFQVDQAAAARNVRGLFGKVECVRRFRQRTRLALG